MSIFKNFRKEDIASIKNVIHEYMPLHSSGSPVITDAAFSKDNIKEYTHDYFQSVYDADYLVPSSNKILDISYGIHSSDPLAVDILTSTDVKLNNYLSFAKVLMGTDLNGVIQQFDQDGDLLAGGTKFTDCFVLCFSRSVVKDEIKKGTFSLGVYLTGTVAALTGLDTITDTDSISNFRVNSPAGEYGFLKLTGTGDVVGLIFYQAGVVIISSSIFSTATDFGYTGKTQTAGDGNTAVENYIVNETLSDLASGFRERVESLELQNTVEINSRIYNCHLGSKEFNYSSNPTYLDNSRIRVKDVATDPPSAYITTVGLYAPDGVLMAVAKLSEPLRKSSAAPMNIRVRVDY